VCGAACQASGHHQVVPQRHGNKGARRHRQGDQNKVGSHVGYGGLDQCAPAEGEGQPDLQQLDDQMPGLS